MAAEREITRLLEEASAGRREALDEVLAVVYGDLKRVAARQLEKHYRTDPRHLTLEPSALVNETYLKLIKQRTRFDNRGHFFAIATTVMLRVLLDYQRSRSRAKRGGGHVHVSLAGIADQDVHAPTLPAFIDALERLDQLDSRLSEIVKLRLVWGLTVAEIAETLACSKRTVERDWEFARRWLETELAEAPE
jgi:RNA polymerase sigma factor (TIGR02999 family)